MSADTADEASIPQPTPPSYGLAATPSALGGPFGAPLGTASPHRLPATDAAAASPVAAMAAVTAKAVTATATETRQEGRAREQMRLQEEERQITRRLLEEVQLRQGAERDRADLLRQREAVLVETAKLEQAEIDRQFRLAQETTNEGWAREFRTRSATERRVAFLKKDRELHETEADSRAQLEREARHDRKAIRDMEQKEWYEATRTSAYYDLHRELDTEDRDRRMQVDQLCSLEKEKQMEYSLEWARHRKMWAEHEGGAAAPAAATDDAASQAQRDGLMQRESERLLAESRIKELERASKSFGQAIYQQGYFIGEAPALAQQQQQQQQQQQADGRFSSTIGSESASYFGLVSPTRDLASKRTTAAASGTSPAQTFSASLSVPSVRALTTPNNDPDACFSPLNAFRGFASGGGGETGSPLRHPPSVTATELAGVSQRTQLEDQLLSQSIARQAQLLHTISSSSGHPVVLEQTEHPTKSTLRGEEETHCYRRATSTTVARESPRRQHSVTARQTATVVAAQTAAAQAAAAAQQAAAAAAAAAAAPSATLPSHAASFTAHVAAAPHLAPAGAVYDSAGNQIRSPAAAAAAAADAAASAAAAAAAAAAAQRQQQQQAPQAGDSSETMTGYVQGLVDQALGRRQAADAELVLGAAPASGVPPPLLPSVSAHPGGPLGPAMPLRPEGQVLAAGAHLSPAVLTPVEAAAAAAAASLPLPVVTPPELIAEVVGEIKKLAEERDSEKLKVEDLSRELAHSQSEMERVLADIRQTHETQVEQQGQELQQKVEVMNALKSDRERANEETAYLRVQLEKTVVEASTLRDELLARSSVATSAGLDRHASLQSPARQHAPQPASFQPPRIQSSALNELLVWLTSHPLPHAPQMPRVYLLPFATQKPAAWGFAPSSVPPQPQQAPQPQAQAPASPQQQQPQRGGEEAGEMEALRAQLEATKRELEDHKQRTRGVDATAQMAHAQLQMQRHMTGDGFAASPGGFYDHPSTSTQDTLEGSAAHKPPLVSSVMVLLHTHPLRLPSLPAHAQRIQKINQ